MRNEKVNESSSALLMLALENAGAEGLSASDFVRVVAGLSGSTLRSYANLLAKQGAIVKRYEDVPGYPHRSPRARYWHPKFYAD